MYQPFGFGVRIAQTVANGGTGLRPVATAGTSVECCLQCSRPQTVALRHPVQQIVATQRCQIYGCAKGVGNEDPVPNRYIERIQIRAHNAQP